MESEESIKLSNLLHKTKCHGLNIILAKLYGSCSSYSLDPEVSLLDEVELKNDAQILLLKLQ